MGTGMGSGLGSGLGSGVVRRSVSGGRASSGTIKKGAPGGFDLDAVRSSFADRLGGGKRSVGGRLEGDPDTLGSHDGHHDDDHHGDHHDDHDDGHHGDHHDYWDIDIDINLYSHPDYCPSGWWYVYGDFDGDGYRDYVCTNGSYSVYWYNWSGAYWDCSPWYGWYTGRYSTRWWTYSVPDRYRGVVYGVDVELVDEPGVVVSETVESVLPEAVPLSAVEVARLEMSLGEPEVAIEAYRAHLAQYPSDWLAMRELGLALIRKGQRGDGVAMIGYSYSQDPLLAWEPVPVELFGGDAHELRDAVIKVVGWGHRNPSSSAWLSVAVLMQGEGRLEPAMRMLERAEGYGLDPAVADQMRSSLFEQ